MALVLADRVRDTTTTVGTGTVTLSGTAPTGYQSFAAVGNANTTYYTIALGSEWEVGIGTYTSSGTTLSRTTVLESSNAGALVPFSAGTKDVFVTYPAERAVVTDSPLALSASPSLSPADGSLSLGENTIGGTGGVGGIELLRQISGAGWQQNFNPMIGRNRTSGYLFGIGQTTQVAFPGSPPNLTIVGTGTARTYGVSSAFQEAPRVGFVSAATAGSLTSVYHNSTSSRFCSVGSSGYGGFLFIARFGTSDAATVSGARMFVGLSTIVTAPTNVDPGAQINQIGVAQLSTSTNLHIVFGGSAAQTPIDLGAAWPANRLSQDMYELLLFSSRSDNTKVTYRVTNLDTGSVAQGTLTNTTPGTTLPAKTTTLAFRNYRTNNATALAVGLDISSLIVHQDL